MRNIDNKSHTPHTEEKKKYSLGATLQIRIKNDLVPSDLDVVPLRCSGVLLP